MSNTKLAVPLCTHYKYYNDDTCVTFSEHLVNLYNNFAADKDSTQFTLYPKYIFDDYEHVLATLGFENPHLMIQRYVPGDAEIPLCMNIGKAGFLTYGFYVGRDNESFIFEIATESGLIGLQFIDDQLSENPRIILNRAVFMLNEDDYMFLPTDKNVTDIINGKPYIEITGKLMNDLCHVNKDIVNAIKYPYRAYDYLNQMIFGLENLIFAARKQVFQQIYGHGNG